MGRAAQDFEDLYQKLSEDIFYFADLMEFTPTWQQRQLLQLVQAGWPQIAVKSGQGTGKTAASVCCGLWRSMRAYQGQTIITAPTMRQCRDVWLKEARAWCSKSHPLIQHFIKITKSKVEIGNDPDWGCVTVTATREENAQGYHQNNLTVIAEEASGVDRDIITQFKGTLSNNDSLFLMIGNPNTRDCAFFDCFNRQRKEWKTLTFNSERLASDYKNTEFGRGILKRNNKIEKEFGKDSDVYRVRVLGEFPHTDPNTILNSDEVESCTGTADRMYKFLNVKRPAEYGGTLARQLGVDFARFGGDENVIFRRQGYSIVEWEHHAHTEPLTVLRKSMMMQKQAGWKDKDTWYVPDANGMGDGMMIHLYEAGKNVVEFKNQMSAVDDQYDNIITEAWFNFRRLVKAKACYIPNDNQLIQQLSGRQYSMTKEGKIIVEPKDKYKERNEGQSPDRADALVMAFYDQVQAVGNITGGHKSEHVIGAKIRNTN